MAYALLPCSVRRFPALNLVCGVTEPGLHKHLATFHVFGAWCRASRMHHVIARARPSSSNLRNISTPVQMVFCVRRMPTISSFFVDLDDTAFDAATVTTVPRPEMENTSSTGIRERLVNRAFRLRNGNYQPHPSGRGWRSCPAQSVLAFQRAGCRTLDDRDAVCAWESSIFIEQLAHFHFDELLTSFGVRQIRVFVQKHHERSERPPDAPAKYARGFAGPGRNRWPQRESHRPSAPHP